MPNIGGIGIGLLYAMGWPEATHLPGYGMVFRVEEKLASEYLRKFLQCPGYQTPFLTDEFHWMSAERLIQKGYRDYELAFGDTWSLGDKVRGKGGFYFIKIVKQPTSDTLARRLWFRQYWPYKWLQRKWPYCVAHDGRDVRWWHALNPKRWMRRPRFTWGEAEVVEFRPSGMLAAPKSPVDPEIEKAWYRIHGRENAQ